MKTTKLILCFLILACIFPPRSLAQSKNVKLPPLCVRGIIFDQEEPMAIVNGKYLREGDIILGIEVARIAESSVEFRYEGELFLKGVGEGCLNVVASIDETVYLGGKPVGMKEIFSDVNELYKEQDSSQKKKKAEAIEKKLSGFFKVAPVLLIVIWALTLLVPWILYAVCMMRIAEKTGTENGWLAWIPILNVYLECQIAGKPAWWFLCFLLAGISPFAIGTIPSGSVVVGSLGLIVIGIVMYFIVWVGIIQARNKPAWLLVLWLIPFGVFILLCYLAFSNGEKKSKEQQKKEQEEAAIDLGSIKKYQG